MEVALATAHGLLNAKVNNGKRHAYTIILIISCCPQAVITYTPYFPNVSNLFLMSRIISYVKLPFAASHASSFTTAANEVTSQRKRLWLLYLWVHSETGWLEQA